MGNIFNKDFQEFIQTLNETGVRYVLVGGYAVILHGYHRTTGDLDVWIEPTKKNYDLMRAAFSKFGLPLDAISIDDFLNKEDMDVFTFGRPPVSIDIMTKVKGLEFTLTYEDSIVDISEGIPIRVINYSHLIIAKKAAMREKDKYDILKLEEE